MVNRNIKNLREIRNYTQEYMAKLLGITQAGYSKIEQGAVDVSSETILKISKILEVSPAKILEFDKNAYLNESLNNENLQAKMVAVLSDIALILKETVLVLKEIKK